jgi:hypothetical protein
MRSRFHAARQELRDIVATHISFSKYLIEYNSIEALTNYNKYGQAITPRRENIVYQAFNYLKKLFGIDYNTVGSFKRVDANRYFKEEVSMYGSRYAIHVDIKEGRILDLEEGRYDFKSLTRLFNSKFFFRVATGNKRSVSRYRNKKFRGLGSTAYSIIMFRKAWNSFVSSHTPLKRKYITYYLENMLEQEIEQMVDESIVTAMNKYGVVESRF